jgi:subtilase family serine protease
VSTLASVAALAALLCASPAARAQGHVYVPLSSLPQPNDAGGNIMARTHLRILVPSAGRMQFGTSAAVGQPNELPPFPGFLFETPASLACVYHLVEVIVPGCNPNLTTANPTGGSRVIALVDAFDDPTAASDLATFSAQFGLPAANVTVVYANGTQPGTDPTGMFEIEEALDLEWAHAMAPEAQLILVEAKNNSLTNLFNAAAVAGNLVSQAGGGEVSMSFGAGEFAQEAEFDAIFTAPGVVYLASAGDSAGVEYPSASPNVVSAGGTTNSRDTKNGKLIIENAWQDGGGGVSQVEPRPAFQKGLRPVVGEGRGTPDISFDANPTTGVWVFDTNPVEGAGWFVVGGTSVAAPSLAGIVNAAGNFRANSQAENAALYSDRPNQLNDIVYGDCGVSIADFAMPGYDLCTGVGTVRTSRGK